MTISIGRPLLRPRKVRLYILCLYILCHSPMAAMAAYEPGAQNLEERLYYQKTTEPTAEQVEQELHAQAVLLPVALDARRLATLTRWPWLQAAVEVEHHSMLVAVRRNLKRQLAEEAEVVDERLHNQPPRKTYRRFDTAQLALTLEGVVRLVPR
jgi:hypothetical protein